MLIVSNDVPVKTLPELIAYAKANPGKLNFASSGIGNLTHLAGELLKVKAGIDIVHVPYKSDAESMTALLGGQVQMKFGNSGVLGPYIRDGKVKALAVTGDVRNTDFPELPTIAEAGVTGYVVTSFFGIVAPAETPQAIIDKFNAAFNQQMARRPVARGAHQVRRRSETVIAAGICGLHRERSAQVARDGGGGGRED